MKIHIVGIPGSGKTTLARWTSERLGVPAFDLDPVVWGTEGERPAAEITRRLDEIRGRDAWVTEGAYHDAWLRPLLDEAAAIVWLDAPLRAAMYRIVKRHVRAELARNNPHPGWVRLVRFLNYTRRTAKQQRTETVALLAPSAGRVVRCRSARDVAAFKERIARDVRG